MAIINKTGIGEGNLIEAEHVTRAIDALSGGSTDSILATGSFTGSFKGDGSQLTGISVTNATSASYAATSSYLNGTVTSASFATTASYVNTLTQSVTISGSVLISGSTEFRSGASNFKDEILLTAVSSFTAGPTTYDPSNINRGNLRIDGVTSNTLSDGTDGQILVIVCVQEATPGTNTVTPTNASGFISIDFNAVGDTATLIFIASKWYIVSSYNVSIT